MNQQQQRLMQIIQKINIFKGFKSGEVQELLQICKIQNYDPDQQIYKAGEPSTEMLILLQGQLMIVSSSGEPLNSVTAGTSIGEMGVFTGQPRSATVMATTRSAGVSIRKIDVEALMGRNSAMYVKVLNSIVALLCERLAAANSQNEQHLKTIKRMRVQLESMLKKGEIQGMPESPGE